MCWLAEPIVICRSKQRLNRFIDFDVINHYVIGFRILSIWILKVIHNSVVKVETKCTSHSTIDGSCLRYLVHYLIDIYLKSISPLTHRNEWKGEGHHDNRYIILVIGNDIENILKWYLRKKYLYFYVVLMLLFLLLA